MKESNKSSINKVKYPEDDYSEDEVCPVCGSDATGEAYGENECFGCFATWPIKVNKKYNR